VDMYMVVLRIVHILAGVFWVGSFYFTFFMLEPALTELGPDAGKLMTYLTQKRRMPMVIAFTAILTVVAGVLLYWKDSNGFDLDFVTSAPGLTFLLGGIAAIVALALGFAVSRPSAVRMGAIGQEMAASGGAGSPALMTEMQAIQKRLHRVSVIDFYLLTFALVAMATARFL